MWGACTNCDTGYTSSNCNFCVSSTHERNPAPTNNDCIPKGGVVICNEGEYSSEGKCKKCDAGTYTDGTGYRIVCNSCPDGQTSEPGKGYKGCFFQYQALFSSFDGVCTGSGVDARQSELSFIDNKQGCKQFADSKATYNFVETTETCNDDTSTCSLLGSTCDGSDKINGKIVKETCRSTCSNCGTPKTQCVIEKKTMVVRYLSPTSLFIDESTNLPKEYVPVCEAFICPNFGFIVKNRATQVSKPTCKAGLEAINAAADSEAATEQVFFIVISVIFVVIVASAYYYFCRHAPSFQRKHHMVIWFGIGLTVFDLCTDWATYGINVGIHGSENQFSFKYGDDGKGGDVNGVRDACLAFCILGTIFTPIDMFTMITRTLSGVGKDDSAFKVIAPPLAILLFEVISMLILSTK